MGSGSNLYPRDARAQVIENCEFTYGPDARFSLVLTREAAGNFKAIVLKTQDGARKAVLSAAAPRYEDALALLLTKSAEAVQEHVDAHGFGLVSQPKEQHVKLDDGVEFEKDSGSSTVTLDDYESLSDDETVSITSVGQAKRKSRRRIETRQSPAKTRQATKAKESGHPKERRGRSRSRSPFKLPITRTRSRSIRSDTSSSESGSDYESHDDNRSRPPPPAPQSSRRMAPFSAFGKPANSANPDPRPFVPGLPKFTAKYPATSAASLLPPPPPPPPPSSISCAPRHMPRPLSMPPIPPINVSYPPGNNNTTAANANNPPFRPQRFVPPPPPPPPPPPFTQPTPNQPQPQPKTHDIALRIRWRGHGEHRVLERLALYPHSIQQAALSYVKRRPYSFENIQPSAAPTVFSGLKAALRNVSVDGVVYDLGAWSSETSSTGTAAGGGSGSGRADLARVIEGLLPSTSSSAVIPVFEVDQQRDWQLERKRGVKPTSQDRIRSVAYKNGISDLR
ncbi:uncharacterized protein C8A04DRAFT_28430 [Dichotomopilus funicola]|uniref:Uncharacterized protein n=1 Tax=Dichotomopilus funicola TaxID=1934379 RepID=A0AAN6V2Y9_9PEZI|nr:hypothetical protein C8A04DRAFT_28430 [Dichotomopilus funicola]